ncbi:hypothetical protein M0805_000368 [Coniferiporia weirii]|nr:hypothetical protein M0805_000368 [Coniferiporia weirii]
MFSGFRNVMENLAQPQPRPGRPGRPESQDFSPERSEHARGSTSFDISSVAQSTGHLAESAFTNLRKSLVSQRPFTVSSPSADSSANPSPRPDRELRPVTKSTLEDRLRASFAIGEASTSTTPGPSIAPSPRPALSPAPGRVASPESTPLPDSPTPSPSRGFASPSPSDLSSPPAEEFRLPKELSDGLSENEQTGPSENAGSSTSSDPSRYPEADIPLPPCSPVSNSITASRSSESLLLNNSIQLDEYENDLKAKLASIEEMYSGVSKSLEELKTTQDAVNAVLADLTPIAHVSDVEGLREHLQKLNSSQHRSRDEILQLTGKLRTYDDRIEELRDTHRLESRSQTELVDSLRKQLEESEALLNAAYNTATQAEEGKRKRQAELDQMRTESQKLKDAVKDEEEKRVKAISLLKSVRQKLVKAEKDRDGAVREVGSLKENAKVEREKESIEKSKLEREMENVRTEKEKDIAGLKAHFDRELAGMREKLEKEFTARKSQLEMEATTAKTAYQKEVSARNAKIQTLESSVHSLHSERDSLFDQLQMRQAEVESSQSLLESLQSSTSELQFQLREAVDRSGLLSEELADARRELEYRDLRPTVSADDSTSIRAVLEAKYEATINELSARLAEADRDRNETEAALSRNLLQKTQEMEVLRRLADTSVQSKDVTEGKIQRLEQEAEELRHQTSVYKEQLSDLSLQKDRVDELEAQLLRQTEDFRSRAEQHERELAEAREREAQTRASNKTLREELRKVQSSAALLEKQRNPGVGYWGTPRHDNASEARISSPPPSTSDLASSSRTGSPMPANSDEEVNLEYLRNVILQFLEHKDMRPHLVRVLSIILHFTPQETRRLIAKV